MGLPMATNLVRGGMLTVGFDPRRERAQSLIDMGGHAAASPQEAATEADVVIAIPFDGTEVREALLGPDGALDGLRQNSTVIVMSTIGPRAMREIAGEMEGRGFSVVDAPVAGGAQGAEAGTLTIIAASAAA